MKRLFNQLAARYRAAAAATLAVASSNALALGGLDKATSTAEEVKTGLYALVGVLAIIYLIYMALMAFTEKKSWSDFGWAVVYVAVAGATVGIGSWAWSLFS